MFMEPRTDGTDVGLFSVGFEIFEKIGHAVDVMSSLESKISF
jgi:hypothetical protein